MVQVLQIDTKKIPRKVSKMAFENTNAREVNIRGLGYGSLFLLLMMSIAPLSAGPLDWLFKRGNKAPAQQNSSSEKAASGEQSCSLNLKGLIEAVSSRQVVGRGAEVAKLESALQGGQDVLLIGPQGSGRSSIVESAAKERTIHRLDWESLANMGRSELGKDPHQYFEDYVQSRENGAYGKPVIFVEKFSELIRDVDGNSTATRRMEAAQRIRATLLQLKKENRIQIIGEASSISEVNALKSFENSTKVKVDLPSADENLMILLSQAPEISQRYGVEFEQAAIERISQRAMQLGGDEGATPKFQMALLRAVANEYSGLIRGGGYEARTAALEAKIKSLEEFLPKQDVQTEAINRLRAELQNARQELKDLEQTHLELSQRDNQTGDLLEKISSLEKTIAEQPMSDEAQIARAEVEAYRSQLKDFSAKRERIDVQMVDQFLNDQAKMATNEDSPSKIKELGIGEIRPLIVDQSGPGLQDIAGNAEVKLEVPRAILKVTVFKGISDKAGNAKGYRAIMYGPPGNGKTLLMKALAKDIRARAIFNIKASDVVNPYVGGTQKSIAAIFDTVRAEAVKSKEPVLVFLDELDAIAMNRDRASDGIQQAVNQLLVELDGASGRLPSNVHIIGATNRPDILDAGITRRGRLEQQIYIRLPDESARREMLGIGFRKHRDLLADDVDFVTIAKKLENWSGASIMDGLVTEVRSAWENKVIEAYMKSKNLSLDDIMRMSPAEHSKIDAESLEFAQSEAGRALKINASEFDAIIQRLIERRSGPTDPALLQIYDEYSRAGGPPQLKPEEVGVEMRQGSDEG